MALTVHSYYYVVFFVIGDILEDMKILLILLTSLHARFALNRVRPVAHLDHIQMSVASKFDYILLFSVFLSIRPCFAPLP